MQIRPFADRIDSTDRLELLAETIRRRLLDVVYSAGAGHIGGDLSCLNMLTALYFHTLRIDPTDPKRPDRDRFVLSKGHCVEALYCVLEARGFMPKELTDTYGTFGTPLTGHPTVKVNGIEVCSGALGHGLSIGLGMALAAKMDSADRHTFVLMGDGEQGEGSIYEAAMAASHYKASGLVAIIDRNGLQISDSTERVMAIEPIDERWTAFGWDVRHIDGDDMKAVVAALDSIDYALDRPHLIISHTTKGKGVAAMENVLKWHHGVPSTEMYAQAVAQIDARIADLESKINPK